MVADRWEVVNGSKDAEAAWRLWNTTGSDLRLDPPDIERMTDNYVITDSDLSASAHMDEELITPEINCADWLSLRLDFNKNYRVYVDDLDRDQIAEVDVRVKDPDTGEWGEWDNLLHWDAPTQLPHFVVRNRGELRFFSHYI